MIDGNPAYPGIEYQWQLAERDAGDDDGLEPRVSDGMPQGRPGARKAVRPLAPCERSAPPDRRCRRRASTGSTSSSAPTCCSTCGSGGTDVCTGIVQGSPLQPVYRGEIVGSACLAVDAAAYDLDGKPVIGELGELVIRSPMPSMPVGFWNDPGDRRYRAAYFEHYRGRLASRRLDRVHRARKLRDHRPLGRNAEPRRRQARDRRAVRGRRGDARGHSTA